MTDLREAGIPEQDIDVILFFERGHPDEGAEPGENDTAEIIVAKQKAGLAGASVPLKYDHISRSFCRGSTGGNES